jgi:deazaflavin-dependent oxidoreductase (nitroreductase family)
MAKTYQITAAVRLSNFMVAMLLRAGIRVGTMTLLTVRGRTSGIERTTPVTIGAVDGQRYLASPFGEVQWVRNVRAAGVATLSGGGHFEQITVDELSPAAAAPILRRILADAPGFIQQYFDVTPDSSLADFEREAPRHPIFRIEHRP